MERLRSLLLAPLAVFGAAAAGLHLADGIPSLLLGQPRRVERHASVEAAERRLGFELLTPTILPDTLSWPPRGVLTTGPGTAAALDFTGPDGRQLLVCQAPGGQSIPERLLPRGEVTHETRFDLEGTPAVLADVVVGSEGAFQELRFTSGRTYVVVRSRGPGDQLLKVARSLR